VAGKTKRSERQGREGTCPFGRGRGRRGGDESGGGEGQQGNMCDI